MTCFTSLWLHQCIRPFKIVKGDYIIKKYVIYNQAEDHSPWPGICGTNGIFECDKYPFHAKSHFKHNMFQGSIFSFY